MWMMSLRRLAGPCSERRRFQRSSNLAARASTLTRSFSEPCTPSWTCAPTDSNPACRLARTRKGLRNVPESAPHAQSSGTDANRHHVIAGEAWICRTWDFTALGRGNTPKDVIEWRMKEAPQLIASSAEGGAPQPASFSHRTSEGGQTRTLGLVRDRSVRRPIADMQ